MASVAGLLATGSIFFALCDLFVVLSSKAKLGMATDQLGSLPRELVPGRREVKELLSLIALWDAVCQVPALLRVLAVLRRFLHRETCRSAGHLQDRSDEAVRPDLFNVAEVEQLR